MTSGRAIKTSLVCLAGLLCFLEVELARAGSASSQQAGAKPFTAAAEPIKWSFGGWAPVDGAHNKSKSGQTTPLPPSAGQPVAVLTIANQSTRADSLSESASSPHERVHLQAAANRMQQASHQVEQLSNRYSLPAPSPIIRDHLFPAAMQHHMMMAQRLQPTFRAPPPPFNQQPQHYQLNLRHQMMMQQHRKQVFEPRPGAQFRSMRPPPQMQLVEAPRSIPRYPGSPPPPPMLERPIVYSESLPVDRIPMIEVSAAGGHRSSPYNQSAAPQLILVQEPHASSPAAPELIHPSTLAAIEKDNLNYENALQQVQAGALEHHHHHHHHQQQQHQQQQQQQQQSNNIQEIKQQQQAAAASQQHHQHQQQVDKGGYLTIPVAVETESDKILTPEDINEIQKHVIEVLPNLKTADKVVKLADTQLTLGDIKAGAQAAVGGSSSPSVPHDDERGSTTPGEVRELHSSHYEAHQNTMKQLEADLKQPLVVPGDYSTPEQQQATGSPMKQASTASAQHEPAPPTRQVEHQLYVASGPIQEATPVEPDQLAEYNLIKNDLLGNFRYEPTRASSGGSSRTTSHLQSTASSPMAPIYGQQSRRPASASRYFQQGARQRPTGGHSGRGTTRASTIMGGRKVSEVMRPLIHTTPIPMMGPPHVPSVEPEKVDAIQLIAGRANDKQPIVVEAHQLVNHTPDGGIDYNSGAPLMPPRELNQQQAVQHNETYPQHRPNYVVAQSDVVQHDNNQGAIIEYVTVSDQALNNAIARQQGYEIANQSPVEPQPVYLSLEQQQQHQSQPHQQQQQQLRQPSYPGPQTGNSPFLYDYTISTQQAAATASSPLPPITQTTHSDTYLIATTSAAASAGDQNQEHHNHRLPSLAWSPSIANEHRQQQLELAGHAGLQQVDMPSTAGYNYFVTNNQEAGQTTAQQQQQHQQQQQQMLQTTVADYHHQPTTTTTDNEHQQHPIKTAHTGQRWRTKAGGSQPNPDAQYDGQLVRGVELSDQEHQHSSSDDDRLQSDNQANEEQPRSIGQYLDNSYGDRQAQQHAPQQQTIELARLPMASNSRPQDEHEQHHQQQQQVDNSQDAPNDSYQRQPQNVDNYQDQVSTPASTQQTQSSNSYLSTNSYVGGAQLNHQTPSDGNYEQQPRYDQSSNNQRYSYMKLDQNRQQNHLAKHQAQHQADLVDLLNSQHGYPTTTPISLTTVATVETQTEPAQPDTQHRQSSQAGQQEHQQQQQQQEQQSVTNQEATTYIVQEQQPSQPDGLHPSPESMLVNESPIHVPIPDQQSLIPDHNQESINTFGLDDGSNAKQTQLSQPAAVYQVYQAYYAPKDHKPLPGYVRLSLDEFNELFRDAEIQYVDRNLNIPSQDASVQHDGQSSSGYDSRSPNGDAMKAAASESKSIVIDRRSIVESRISNSSSLTSQSQDAGKKFRLGHAVKKIISIKNSRHTMKDTLGLNKRATKKAQISDYSHTTTVSLPMSTIPVDPKTFINSPIAQRAQPKSVTISKKKTGLSSIKKLPKQKTADTEQGKDSAS